MVKWKSAYGFVLAIIAIISFLYFFTTDAHQSIVITKENQQKVDKPKVPPIEELPLAIEHVHANKGRGTSQEIPKGDEVPPHGKKGGLTLHERSIPIERGLLAGDSINFLGIRSALASPDFLNFVAELRDQAADNQLANDVNQLYESALTAEVSKFNNSIMRVNAFSCGTIFCAGSITVNDEESWKAFMASFQGEGKSPSYVFTDFPVTIDDSRTEHRFMFSTDASNSSDIQVRP